MESVIFDGKEYLKASVLAERFNYTQDYLGQLCRAKKVDARLVGRAWYLNLDSLQGHKKTRYKTPDKPTVEPKKPTAVPPPHFLTRIDVEPVLKKKTVTILKNNKAGKLNEFSVKYENDDYSLIPRINRASVSKEINIRPADADDLSVKATKESVRVTTFKAEPLPEVYLKGILKVDGIPEVVHEEEELLAEARIVPPVVDSVPAPVILHTPEIKSHGQSDIKKPIKIKLYRQENVKPEASKNSSEIGQSVRRNVPMSAPVKLTPLETRSVPKNEIPVKMAQETVLPANPVKVAEIQEVPHANLKVFAILIASLCLAGVSLLPKNEIKSQDGSLVQTWEISLHQLQEVVSFLVTLIL